MRKLGYVKKKIPMYEEAIKWGSTYRAEKLIECLSRINLIWSTTAPNPSHNWHTIWDLSESVSGKKGTKNRRFLSTTHKRQSVVVCVCMMWIWLRNNSIARQERDKRSRTSSYVIFARERSITLMVWGVYRMRHRHQERRMEVSSEH